jgi:hypothetical protein
VHEFDTGESRRCRLKGLKPQHWPHQSLDGAMVLFDDVVEVLDLTDLNARLVFRVVAFDRSRVGPASVDCDLLGRSMTNSDLSDRPLQRSRDIREKGCFEG